MVTHASPRGKLNFLCTTLSQLQECSSKILLILKEGAAGSAFSPRAESPAFALHIGQKPFDFGDYSFQPATKDICLLEFSDTMADAFQDNKRRFCFSVTGQIPV